jgi:hypothetical protein
MTKLKKTAGEGGEPRAAYGIAAITRSFHGVDFPAEKQYLIDKIKDKPIVNWAKDASIDLREILEALPDKTISGITELTHLVNERMHHKAAG